MGRAPSPKYPRGRAPSPKYSRGRDAREEDRALVWEEPGPEDDPDSVPGLHSLPLLTGTRLTTGREGREEEVSGHNSHLQSKLDWERPSPVWLFFFNIK